MFQEAAKAAFAGKSGPPVIEALPEEAHPGARASRPHKSSRSFSHLLHRNQPAADHSRKNGRSLLKTNHEWTRINTNRPKDRWTCFNHKRRQCESKIYDFCDAEGFCPVGVTLSWEEALLSRWCDPGARASRPHKSSRSFSHLLHRNQPAAAPCLCFGRAHAVPAGRAVGCNIAGKLSGNRRDSMRAGRPRSRGCRPDGEVGGIRRATSLKAGLSPLGNSRLPASRAPAPRDWADPSRRTIN